MNNLLQYPVLLHGGSYDPAKLEKINEAFKFLDGFVSTTPFTAGDSLTLADLALVATVSNFDVLGFDMSPYKNVTKWYARTKQTAPGYEEANGKNALIFKDMFDQITQGKIKL